MRLIPTIGIVTVTYNSGAVINQFMHSILEQTYTEFILYVIDNVSSDDTLAKITACRDSRVILIVNDTNVGFAEASNQGIRAALDAGCGSVLFINNDTECGPDLLHNLVTGLREYKADMASPKILYHHDQHTIWSAGGGFHPLKGYAGFHFGINDPDCGQFNVPRFVEHAPACCLLATKNVFDTIGLMDPRYFVYLDDTDFCYRALQAGLTIIYLPTAILLHKASSLTGGPESDFSVRYRTRNQIYFMLKHLGLWRNLILLPAFYFYQIVKLVLRRIGWHGFALREKAFVEGLRVWRESLTQTDGDVRPLEFSGKRTSQP